MFFQTMFQMMSPGVDYNLTLSRTDNRLTVLVMPKVADLKDSARHNLVPFTLTGGADEIDRGFFPAMQQPIARAAGMLTNMAEYEKQADKAAANSKAAKEEKTKVDREAKEKKDKYDGFIKKADEMDVAGNSDGALLQLQQARIHVTDKNQKALDDRIAALKAKLGQGSLFDMTPAEPVANPGSEPSAFIPSTESPTSIQAAEPYALTPPAEPATNPAANHTPVSAPMSAAAMATHQPPAQSAQYQQQLGQTTIQAAQAQSTNSVSPTQSECQVFPSHKQPPSAAPQSSAQPLSPLSTQPPIYQQMQGQGQGQGQGQMQVQEQGQGQTHGQPVPPPVYQPVQGQPVPQQPVYRPQPEEPISQQSAFQQQNGQSQSVTSLGSPSQSMPQGYPSQHNNNAPYGLELFNANSDLGQNHPGRSNPHGGDYQPNQSIQNENFLHDPKVYEGIVDVQATHVGQVLTNQYL